jgi:hypothetical protein
MMILAYSGESIVTSDRMGNAVVDYARALVTRNAADVVDVPVVLNEAVATARLLIGPTSQLIAVPADEAEVPLDDAVAIAEIEARIEAMEPHRLVMSKASPWDQFALVYDFL